ncbi:MAG: ABC transporter substrate-binding protein [Oscillospiraceae bacterium]|nr:ABC transporter substrate-binding protein [Oscillospiraceae bacterium]
MIKKIIIKIILFVLSALIVTGCWLPNMPVYVPPFVPTPPVFDAPPENVNQRPTVNAPAHGRFTIRYAPINTLNPIIALNRDNINITSLMYESLFELNENLVAVPVLCESWETEDNLTFKFTIYPDIPMHDGSTLTADDVAYSIRQAQLRGRHRSKVHGIHTTTSDGDLTVTIVLESPNARFTRLLDIPIIKDGSIESTLPPGTGPYIFPNPDDFRLIRFVNHRDYSFMPLTTIFLREANDNELTELFDQGALSLLWDDPASAFDLRLNRDHEPRYYNTTSMQFLGFNANSYVLRDSDVRRAIGCGINRQVIVDTIMNVRPGQTIAAPVAISPAFDMYDEEWERRVQDPLTEMGALLDRAGIDDYDNDGLLEMPDGVGGPGIKFTLQFLVNIENTHKVAAAEHIAASLRGHGFDINVRVLPWTDFIKALEEGRFDMYYGEVQIGADFDLSPLLLPGDNNLNYGRTGNTAYKLTILNFLAADTQEEVSIAGKQLCDEIRTSAPFIPILYKRHAIYTPMGVVSSALPNYVGVAPSQSGIFRNFRNWAIDLEMLT